MLNFIATILISAVATFISAVGLYNYLPLGYLEIGQLEPKLGATVTTLNATDLISTSRTTINTNFTNLNNGKIENSTTSVAAITTLSNLASIGTITTGSWNATAIPVNKGGTGTTSPSTWMVMLGNGANGLTMASTTGTTGQFLTSNGAGAYPSWQTSSVDQAIAYNWTGAHSFAATTTMATTTVTRLGVGTTTPSFTGLNLAGNAYITGGVGIGVATTSPNNLVVRGLASTTNMVVSGVCTNCATNGYEQITNTGAGPTTANTEASVTATCTTGKKVIGGGGSNNTADQIWLRQSYPDTTASWTVTYRNASSGSGANTMTAYAICVNP